MAEESGFKLMAMTGQVRARSGLVLVGWLVLCFGVGLVSSIFTARNLSVWYAGLVKPPLNPPSQVFGPVWTILYALMAVSAWMVWKTRDSTCRRRGLLLFLVQLGLNF